MADLNDFFYTDDVDDVLAANVNDLLAATMRSEYKNVETLSADKTLTDADCPIQRLDCNGAHRTIKLPTGDAVENHPFLLVNSTSATYSLYVTDSSGASTYIIVLAGRSALIMPDGDGGWVTWRNTNFGALDSLVEGASGLNASSFSSTTTLFPIARGRKARGTYASPTAAQADDVSLSVEGFLYGATGFTATPRARMQLLVAENATDAAQGTYITLSTTPLGSTTMAEAMRITPAGIPRYTKAQKRVSSAFTKTSDTTLANITGLSVTVEAGNTYMFEAQLYTTSNTSGGVKAAIAGTATATAIIYEAIVHEAAAVSAQTKATSLGTAVGGVTAVAAANIRITGTITVNAAGTLTVQFAQNASNVNASTVLVGSVFSVTDIT
jgi:hypothetical protein